MGHGLFSRGLLVAGVTLAVLLAACDGAKRDDSGQIVSGGNLDIFEIRAGDCFQDPAGFGGYGSAKVGSLTGVPCSESHDNEAYFDFDLRPGPWPGESAIFAEADAECQWRFESYVNSYYRTSRLEFSYMYPTVQSWNDDDREVVCFLFDVNLEKLAGTMRGSGE